MNQEKIINTTINNIKVDSISAAIYIKPALEDDIYLEYSAHSNFHVVHKVVEGTLIISAEVGMFRKYMESNDVLRVYIPEKLIKRLDILGNASFVHVVGKDDMLRLCNIDVTVAAVYLENIYADTTVKTLTGAIKVKNESVRSNIHLETQIGVIDMTLDELPDNVSIYTKGIVKRNAFLRARNNTSPNERYTIKAESLIGVINIH